MYVFVSAHYTEGTYVICEAPVTEGLAPCKPMLKQVRILVHVLVS